MRYVYLHGFASGPQSRKAQSFRTVLAETGIHLEIPDLAGGDFEHLTITSQLAVVESLLQGTPARLIGSSMGGYVAGLYASTHPEVDRLVLLAPAFGFSSRWETLMGNASLQRWHTTGWLEVFHYGDKANRRVHYGLYEDARRYPPNPEFPQPTQIFHGTDDQVVPIDLSRSFVAGHANARLTEVSSDHELLGVLAEITRLARAVLIA